MERAGTAGLERLIARRFPWICAICLHLSLYALLVDPAGSHRVIPAAAKPMAVDIILEHLAPVARTDGPAAAVRTPDAERPPMASPSDLAALPGNQQQPEVRPPSGGASTEAETPQRTWVTATGFHAREVLDDPRSAKARSALATLSETERREQLCALEAMEQVRQAYPGFQPTRLVPHALRNSYREANRVVAPAAALRSHHLWYEIAYRCLLNDSGTGITGFEYALGAPVERALWEELGLAATY